MASTAHYVNVKAKSSDGSTFEMETYLPERVYSLMLKLLISWDQGTRATYRQVDEFNEAVAEMKSCLTNDATDQQVSGRSQR